MKSRLLFLITALSLTQTVYAGPIFPSRFVTIAPKLRPQSDPSGAKYLTQHGLWANLQKGFKSAGDRFGWSIAFGGILEFFSWSGASLGMQGSIEILADTRNDISFNPQGVNWEEGFIYNQQIGNVELSGGYLHRCVHNVDNLQTTNPEARNMQRTLIYGSLTSRALLRDFYMKGIGMVSAWVGADYYIVTEDYRYPEQQIKLQPDVEQLKLSIDGGFSTRIIGRGVASLYARLGGRLAFYSDTTITDYRAEFGLNIKGEALTMQIFLGGEGLSDDGGSVIPRPSDFFYLGIRFLGNNIAF
jgi:hypothetical protein